MKKRLIVFAMAAMLAVGTQFAFAADKAAKKPAGEPGAMVVDTVKATAKVTAIDAAKRTVTLAMGDKSKTITCGPEVINFDQIKVGDLLKVTFVEAFAVYIQKAGAPAGGEEVKTVTLAPKGAKPGMLVTDTIVLKAKIDAVNAKKGTLTITTAAGETKTMKVAKNVKGLKGLKKGDDIVVRYTEALAVVIEAPKK
ncbi:MAG: hypothetical protein M0P16_08040 [Syntrophales bacterium]|jgi:hypothetical protein|nr:hypothetical protein [Syntrophales bacterium]MCK9391239.1 hypothetical protein [Syntrophales bacterium]